MENKIPFPDGTTFHELADNEIYIDSGEKYDFHRLTMQETQNINSDWKDLPLYTTYLLKDVKNTKLMYDDIADTSVEVHIIILEDENGKIYKLLCPGAIIEQFEIIELPPSCYIFLRKSEHLGVDWIYTLK